MSFSSLVTAPLSRGYFFMGMNIVFSVVTYLLLDYTYDIFPDISVLQGMFWGFSGATMILFFPLLFQKPFRCGVVNELKQHHKLLALVVLLSTTANVLWIFGIQNTTAGIVSLLENTQALWAFVLAALFLGEAISLRKIIAFVVVLLGVGMISTLRGEIHIWTSFFVLLSAFLFAFQSFCIKQWGQKINGIAFAVVRLLGIFFCISVLFLVLSPWEFIGWYAFVLLTIAHILGVIICRYFFFEAHKYLSISTLNFSILILPFFTVFFGVLFFGAELSLQKILGGAIIVGGMVLFLRCDISQHK